MKRKILFRGYSTDSNQWVYGFYREYLIYQSCGKCLDHINYFIDLSRGGSEYVKPETVGQFTGLYDKNGKEIYEGDIVSNGHRNYSISFSLRYGWMLTMENFGYSIRNETTDSSFDNAIIDGVAVIGNVYDNPELLDCSRSIQYACCDKPLSPPTADIIDIIGKIADEAMETQ